MNMADQTTGIPQDGTQLPAQDLQINLEDAPVTENQTPIEEIKSEEHLDLDLNLSEAPKDDDRLKTEDQKNEIQQIQVNIDPIVEPVVEQQPVVPSIPGTKLEDIFAPMEETLPEIPTLETQQETTSEPISQPIIETPTQESIPESIENIPETVQEVIPVPTIEPVIEVQNLPWTTPEKVVEPTFETQVQVIQQWEKAETSIQEINISNEEIIWDSIPKQSSLEDDMKMISELEWHASAGGLAPEANITIQTPPVVETPKTFDLDSMLGNPVVTTPVNTAPEVVPQTPTPTTSTPPTAIPMQMPGFTTPTPTQQAPIQAIPQVTIPHTKNVWVKVLLFAVMFAGLGFTTFFILKTMYPIEFASILGGQPAIHASADLSWTTDETPIVNTEITGSDINTGSDISTSENTGTTTNESGTQDVFWELSDLGTTTTPVEQPGQNDIGKLTDYVKQGNDFLTQGKTIGNSKMIMYGLYMSKKWSTFLEDIANGKQIDNLSGYFAQSEKYIVQLQEMTAQTWASTVPSTNDIQTTPPDTGTTPQDTWGSSE